MNISNRVIKFSYNTIFLHLTVIEKSQRLTCCQTCCLFLKWMRRQKVSTESPDCGCDIVFDCLNGWRCCKVNYWVFVMTVFAVYSLIVLIVPCLGPADMRGLRSAHNISGSREIIQSNTKKQLLIFLQVWLGVIVLVCFLFYYKSWSSLQAAGRPVTDFVAWKSCESCEPFIFSSYREPLIRGEHPDPGLWRKLGPGSGVQKNLGSGPEFSLIIQNRWQNSFNSSSGVLS